MSDRDTTPVPSQVERQLLRLCLRGLWDPQALGAAQSLVRRARVDWIGFKRAADQEHLAPLVYHVMRDRQMVPPEVAEALAGAYYTLAGHNSVLLHELAGILRLLRDGGVPVLLLKGAALLEPLYGNVGLRPMVDVDLLVPLPHVRTAEEVVGSLGYGMIVPDPWRGFSWRYRNSVQYTRPSGGLAPFGVGLHTHLYDVPFYERIPSDGWFARGLAWPGGESGVLMPAPEDHLVYLCGHMALHHRYAPELLRYLDLALLIHRTGPDLDWDGVVARAADWRLVIPTQRTLGRLEALWPGTVPSGTAAALAGLRPTGAEQRVHAWVTERPRTPTSDTLLALATMPGVGRRVRFLMELAFPSPAYMRERYCPGHPRRWPLAYVQRAGLALHYLLQRLG